MVRERLTYANVVASLALFVALGGTSYAVARNSVGTRELKSNAVTSAKIRNGTVGPGDLSSAVRSAARGPRGSLGPGGPPGQSGPPGPRGPSDARINLPGGAVALPRAANVRAVVGKVTLPAGQHLVMFSAQAGWFNPGGLIVSCRALAGGAEVVGTNAVLGGSAGSTRIVPLTAFAMVDRPTPVDLTLECNTDNSLPGDQNQVVIENRQLAAIRVEQLIRE